MIRPLSEVADSQRPDNDSFPIGIKEFDEAMDGGWRGGELVIVSGKTGEGKCLAKGTPVVMFDGSIRAVEDIKTGEQLMGPDSRPRKVLSLANGIEPMYRISQVHGDSYVVNESHILSLVKTGTYKVRNISVRDFLKLNKTERRNLKGYIPPNGVEFPKKDLILNPYYLGLWLGDGTSENQGITNADNEVVDFLKDFASGYGLRLHKTTQKNNLSSVYSPNGKMGHDNPVRSGLRSLNLLKNKHIPEKYATSSREDRLALLAGMIDSDGYKNRTGYVFVNKSERLAYGLARVARSLGIRCTINTFVNKKYKTTFFKVGLTGECDKIPVRVARKVVSKRLQKKSHHVTGITVTPLYVGDYYGFEIDGDRLFLLGDYTVTHNTTWTQNITMSLADRGIPALWFSYEMSPWYLKQKFELISPIQDKEIYAPEELVAYSMENVEQKIEQAILSFACKVIFIDHLHYLIPLTSSGENMSFQVGSIVRQLKLMAVKHNVIIVLICHVKKIYQDEELDLSSIRDSSLIAQEADYVFLIERVKEKKAKKKLYYEEDTDGPTGTKWTNQSKIQIAKNRRTGGLFYKLFTLDNGIFRPVEEEQFYEQYIASSIG